MGYTGLVVSIYKNKQILSWAFYDWANSAFATIVLAGFFPLFFKQFWSAQNTVTESTFQLGVGNALASLIIVMLAPLFGAITLIINGCRYPRLGSRRRCN